VTANYLISNNPGDDYFRVSEGAQVTGHHWFGRRLTLSITSNNPNGFEWIGADGGALQTNVDVSEVTLCGTGEDSFSVESSYAVVLDKGIHGTIEQLAVTGFDFGLDVGTPFATGDVIFADSTFWRLVFGLDNNATEFDTNDDDGGFADGTIVTDDSSNRLDPELVPFTIDDCLPLEGPARSVTQSALGAFTDGAGWMRGSWVAWYEE
jgi:hypothetical protein